QTRSALPLLTPTAAAGLVHGAPRRPRRDRAADLAGQAAPGGGPGVSAGGSGRRACAPGRGAAVREGGAGGWLGGQRLVAALKAAIERCKYCWLVLWNEGE